MPASRVAAPVEGHVRSADGTQIGYLKVGRGPSVVFCHGSLATGDDWLPVALRLADRFTCFVMSRRGRGRSQAGGEQSLERECEDIAAVREAAGSGAHLVGHSYGAICVLEALLRSPPDGGKLVLYEPPLPIDEPVVGAALQTYRTAIAENRFEDALLAGFRDFVRLPEDELATLRKSMIWRQALKLAPTWLPELEVTAKLPLGAERYRAITAPTLLLIGGETAAHHRRAVAGLQRTMPAAQIATIAGHGHTAHTTASARVAATIAEFLAEPLIVRS